MGKHARGEVVGVGDHPHGFDIDANLASHRKRVHRDIVAVRYAESQVRASDTPRERGLARVPVHELDRVAAPTQPCREQLPQTRARDDKAAAVAIENKATGSLPLLLRQQRGRCAERIRAHVESRHHDLDRPCVSVN